MVLVAGRLDDDRVGFHVDDLGFEHLGDVDDVTARFAVRLHLHHRQLAAHDVLVRDVPDVHDVDQLVELTDDLLGVRVSVDDEGHAGEPGLLGVPDREAFDVEPALPPLGGDAIEHARPVFDQRDDRMRPDLAEA